ncbi:MAG: DEAD/DEAH box helicase [Paludisphaera borealis]|uniref:DEAD/DEAH box helicase n=1 Tax=Paludisphaera borealis TaxID=1387353 RepID=UPI0028518FF9|nr:DEAD/DEAH box helicase [Paludisphaera borealis]MDR3619780.1 DEAD/DEAH box helicase [Paludisphaera borealis]
MSLAGIEFETEEEPTDPESEALGVLVGRIGRKGGAIPAEALARHVMSIVPADEWPVRIEAVDALLRRLESARKDDLRIDARPADGRTLGRYATRRKGSNSRPYHTVVSGVDPIVGRCDCPDFLKNSLGVCKHVLAVVEHLYSRPRLLARAIKEQAETATDAEAEGLTWDPIRPLVGFGDWLERVVWRGAGKDAPRGLFKVDAQGDGLVKNAFRDAPEKRLAVVESLLAVGPKTPGDRGCDPAVHALLAQEQAKLTRIIHGVVGPSNLKNTFKGLSRPLYPYQREGVNRFLRTTRLLLADDMGLGKTAQAIACCSVLWRAGRAKRGLIIAPAALKPQWAREWAQFSDLLVQVVDGPPAERQRIYERCNEGFLIINYEQLLRDLEMVRGWAPDLVVLDEAQRIKNWATKTALSVKGLNPRYRLVLTGTPMENRVEELASVVEWVDDMALEPKWRLPAVHAVRADGRKEVVGVRNLDTLRERLAPCMLRRVRQEVLDQLPPRTDVRVPIEMTDEQMEEHDALNQPIAQLVRTSMIRPLKQHEFLRLMSLLTTQRIISNGLAQLRFEDVWPSIRRRSPDDGVLKSLSAPKLIELRQLIRQLVLDQGRKVVVFSQWRRMLHLAHWAVSDLLAEDNLRAGFFTGAENPKRRTQNIVEFHDDPTFRILFASDAGGVGLNLQRAANSVVNLELPWNPAVLEQRIGRIYRIGQNLPIDVYNLIAEQGIESRIADLVGSKQAFFKGLFDGQSDSIQFENAGSFLSRVQKLYEDSIAEAARGGGGVDDETETVELADAALDDAVADPFDELIEAGDESRDPVAVVSETTLIEERRAAMPASDGEVRQLFSQLSVRREPNGNLVIEAPAEAADTLGALFEGMAAMLRASTRPPE